MQSETVLAKQKANKTQPRKAASSSPKEDSDDSEAKRYRLGRQGQRQFLETSSSRASTIKSHVRSCVVQSRTKSMERSPEQKQKRDKENEGKRSKDGHFIGMKAKSRELLATTLASARLKGRSKGPSKTHHKRLLA
ncbi:hypothetical protein KSS87_014272 [Heliosperma pusillum]|nr:hypothetical protein KSS87_014272 [Heliosperma pusillum]